MGFEATGLIDSKLPTVGIWAKASQEVRSPLSRSAGLGGWLSGTGMIATVTPPQQESELPVDDFSRGVVFYLGEKQRIVGVLTWNLFGKMDLARQVGVASLLLCSGTPLIRTPLKPDKE